MPPKEINDLTMDQIVAYMKVQFDSNRFVIWERFKFWTTMQRRPGESIQELAERIRQAAATWDFFHFLRWRRTSSTSQLLSRLPSKWKTPPKLQRKRSTAQNPFRRWRLRRNHLDNSQCISALPRRKCQLDSNAATVVAIQAILQLRASSKMPSAISAN